MTYKNILDKFKRLKSDYELFGIVFFLQYYLRKYTIISFLISITLVPLRYWFSKKPYIHAHTGKPLFFWWSIEHLKNTWAFAKNYSEC